MPLRHTVEFSPPGPLWETDDEPVESLSQVDPAQLQWSSDFGFVAQWHLPDVTWIPTTEDGEAGVHLRAQDGSRTSARSIKTDGGFLVSQAGPRRLWERVEQAYTFWQQAGRPITERFGIAASATEQYVWYDQSTGPHRWLLPPGQPAG